MDFEIARLQPLPHFSWYATVSRECDAEYFRYYGIAFEEQIPDLDHHFGIMPLAGFDIAVHFYSHPSHTKTVIINHGYYDHCGLYGGLMNMLFHMGCNVLVYDLPGHGLSTGERAGIESFAQYQAVLAGLLEQAKPYLTAECYMLGQSTGGAIAMDYVLSNPCHGMKKLVLLAPLVIPVHWPFLRGFLKIAAPFTDRMPRIFSDNSHDEEFLHFVKSEDPLQSPTVKRSWGKALVDWQPHFAALPATDLPVLFIQGDSDATVDWRYNLDHIAEKFSQLQLLMLEGAMHHLANESSDYKILIEGAIAGFIND